MLALLFFGAVLQQRRAEHPDAEAVERRAAVERAHFRPQNFGLVARESAAAVLTRPLRHRPSLLHHALEPQSLSVGSKFPMPPAPASVFFSPHRPPQRERTIRLEPGVRLFPKTFKIFHSYVWC